MSLARSIETLLGEQLAKLRDGRYAVRPPIDLERRVNRIKKKFGGGHADLVTKQRVETAIRVLLSKGAGSLTRRHKYVLAYALAQPATALGGAALIEKPELIGRLINLWRSDAHAGALRGASWRGLFRSYLQTPKGHSATQLANVLRDSFDAVRRRTKGAPEWLNAVVRHECLLSANPCASYVEELLVGRRNQLDDLVSSMAPPGTSWFWDELVEAVCQQIDQMTDERFIDRIPFLLRFADEARLGPRRDAVLARTLDRHARTRQRARHQILLAYALDRWKSPQLRTSVLWSQVRPDTKQMVCGWLALEDLEDFYRLCQGAGTVDERRLRFWLRYKEQIAFSQIILGNAMFYSRDSEVAEFRDRKKGRLARLTSGPIDNNAIIMQIGEWTLIEFSQTGNACYPYRTEHLKVELGVLRYPLDGSGGLKSKIAVRSSDAHTLIHNGSWEWNFEYFLRERSIRPDQEPVDVRPQGHIGHRQSTTDCEPHELGIPADLLGNHNLVAVLNRARPQIFDYRRSGGALWVIPELASSELGPALLRAGFKHKLGKGYHFP